MTFNPDLLLLRAIILTDPESNTDICVIFQSAATHIHYMFPISIMQMIDKFNLFPQKKRKRKNNCVFIFIMVSSTVL